MDNNNSVNPAPQPAVPAGVASTPSSTENQTVNAMTPPPAGEPKSSKKMILVLLLGVVIVVLLVGGAYLFVNSKKGTPPPVETTQTSQQDTLESDINAVDVGSLDTEFTAVDQDLQTL